MSTRLEHLFPPKIGKCVKLGHNMRQKLTVLLAASGPKPRAIGPEPTPSEHTWGVRPPSRRRMAFSTSEHKTRHEGRLQQRRGCRYLSRRSFFHNNAYTIIFSADDTLFFSQRRIYDHFSADYMRLFFRRRYALFHNDAYTFSFVHRRAHRSLQNRQQAQVEEASARPGRRGKRQQAQVEEATKPRSKRQAPSRSRRRKRPAEVEDGKPTEVEEGKRPSRSRRGHQAQVEGQVQVQVQVDGCPKIPHICILYFL